MNFWEAWGEMFSEHGEDNKMKDRKENEKKRIPPLRFTELTEGDIKEYRYWIPEFGHRSRLCLDRFVRTFERKE